MLGSEYVLKIPTTAIPVMSHITWKLHPEWIACASIKSGEKTSSNHRVTPPDFGPAAPYSRRDVPATRTPARTFPRTGSYEEPLSPTTQVHRVWPHFRPPIFPAK